MITINRNSNYRNGKLYYWRGLAKKVSGDVTCACLDWNKAISLGDIYSKENLKI